MPKPPERQVTEIETETGTHRIERRDISDELAQVPPELRAEMAVRIAVETGSSVLATDLSEPRATATKTTFIRRLVNRNP